MPRTWRSDAADVEDLVLEDIADLVLEIADLVFAIEDLVLKDILDAEDVENLVFDIEDLVLDI